MKYGLALLFCLWGLAADAQPVPVVKTNPMRVYVHYMPWFETPATSDNGRWGIHWTMANRNPNVIADPATGRRQIAAHYYPLIGPYASSDTAVLEYHLLLMKFSGIDGLLIDFYGEGSNDLPLLLRNTNAAVPVADRIGVQYAMVFEDQFAATRQQARANMGYLGDRYAGRSNYIRLNNKSLIGVFGPQRYQTPADWTAILDTLAEDPTFVTLWYESAEAGTNADGEFSWVYMDSSAGVQNFNQNRSRAIGTAIGSAFPGFEPYYAQGGWTGPVWSIKPNSGAMLDRTLALATQYAANIDALQLVTWNDFGEGTMIEPTLELGYTYLRKVQTFTGVTYGQRELELILTLYQLRKANPANQSIQAALNHASTHLTQLQVPQAAHILDSLQALAAIPETISQPLLYPQPVEGLLHIPASYIKGQTLVIRDALGRIVHQTIAQPVIDLSTLPPGLYSVEGMPTSPPLRIQKR